ncbi:MAG: OB-fold nucleic acid binding domain-containing protein [Candidatus Nanohaloarchaea archaeon]
MEVEDLVEKVVEASELSEDDLMEKVDEKMEEFEGLVSEEGAVHLVAKEHGVELAEEASEDLKIENIVPDMRKVVVEGRVLNVSDLNTFERDGDEEDGKVQNLLLGDDTGTIRVTLWDDQTEIAENVDEGDVIKMAGCYTVEDDRGNAELRLGDSATVKMADDQDRFDDIENQASTSEVAVSEITTEGSSYRTRGMIMEVYTSNPFYRVDPETGDTVREDDDGNYVTDSGEEVEDPEGRLAISGVIDDGTENIRCVFFGEQARKLLDLDEEAEKEMDEDAVEESAEDAKGLEIEVEGRTRYNDYFDRIELLVNNMQQVDTQEEIETMLEILQA